MLAEDRSIAVGQSTKSKFKLEAVSRKDNTLSTPGITSSTPVQFYILEPQEKPRPIMGVIRGSGKGVVKSDTSYEGLSTQVASTPLASTDGRSTAVPFRTDASALGSYTPPVAAGSGRRRFSEMPVQSASSSNEQSQSTYRDRAAERRSLYGSSSSFGGDLAEHGIGDSNRDSARRGVMDLMPFPPGVGGRGAGDSNSNTQSFEVITAEKAIDETNVGNRMLRSMGWQEGLGLGKDGSGMVEPVQAQSTEKRAGLGSQLKKVDPSLEVQAGDSYRTLIQKKALARFREMS